MQNKLQILRHNLAIARLTICPNTINKLVNKVRLKLAFRMAILFLPLIKLARNLSLKAAVLWLRSPTLARDSSS